MNALAEQIAELDQAQIRGCAVGVRDLMVGAAPLHAMSIGARVAVKGSDRRIRREVVGFSGPNALLASHAAGKLLAQAKREATAIPNDYRRLEEMVGLLETEN